MPKRRTEDAVHVVLTDHRIPRLPPSGDPLARREERHDRYSGKVALFYPPAADPAYVAIASRDAKALAAAVARIPDAPAAFHNELGRLVGGRAAMRHYRDALARDRRHVPTLIAAGELLIAQGDSGAAISLLRGADHPEVLNTVAVAQAASGKFRDAESALRRALTLDEWLPMTHVNLGVMLQAQGNRVGAAQVFRRALALQPDLARARQLLDTIGQAKP
jgi:Flp pilus assembly protein TadD